MSREVDIVVAVDDSIADDFVEDMQVAASESEGITLRSASRSYTVEVEGVIVMEEDQ